ncbi:MAG: hypothetical protein REI11_10000 [Patulibacter sp.]|nr:hypothetical protein [Patulibacter sp.]
MSPGPRSVTVTTRARDVLATHQRRVAEVDAIADRERASMYDAIATLIAAGELTVEAAAAQLETSTATLNRALAARRRAKADAS